MTNFLRSIFKPDPLHLNPIPGIRQYLTVSNKLVLKKREFINAFFLLLAFFSSLQVFAQTTTQIGLGTDVPVTTLYGPIYRVSSTSTTTGARTAMLWTASEIATAGIPAGATIIGVEFKKTHPANFNGTVPFQMLVANTVNTSLATTLTWAGIQSTHTLAINNPAFNLPFAAGWVPFVFSTPFTYTGGAFEIATEYSITGLTTPHSTDAFRWEYTKGQANKIVANATATGATLDGTNAAYKDRPNIRIIYTTNAACTNLPTPGTATSSVNKICPGAPFVLHIPISTSSSQTCQWQSSPDGINWTDIAVATSPAITRTQNATTFYRANVTCGPTTVASGSVQVSTILAPLNGTYTIDRNATASANSYESLTAFISDISCRGISGPVTINVASGSGPYNEQVVIPAITGTSAINTITFNGNGNTVTFKPLGTSTAPSAFPSNPSVIRLDGADYIKLDNFVIATTDDTYGWGIHLMNGADNNTISNNTITIAAKSTGTTTVDENNSAGIVLVNSTTTVSTTGNSGINNLISGNTISGGNKGIHISSDITISSNNQLKNNIIRDFFTTAIKVNAAKGTVVEGNDLSRPTRADLADYSYIISVIGKSQETIISKNRIHNTHGGTTNLTTKVFGIYYDGADAPAGSENIVRNNLMYDFNNVSDIYGIYNLDSDGALYFHNTLDLTNPANTGSIRGFYQNVKAINIKFINNIITIGGASGTKHAMYFAAPASSIISNNNVLYAPNFNIGYYNSSPAVMATTLADWKAVNGKAHDQNSVSALPLFANAATAAFKPTNVDVNNIAQILSGTSAVTDDFTGATRNTTSPDPGAYEFMPAANDGSIEAILSLTSPAQPNVSLPVEVTIKNYGSNALTTATINWKINGIAQASYAWTGNLTSNQVSAPITIGNYSFPAGPHTLEVCTSNPNGTTDEKADNDCKDKQVIVCLNLAGNYTINKNATATATNFQSFAAAVQTFTTCGISGPVTVDVVAGSGPYNEQVVIPAINGVSATNTLTFNGNGNTVSFTKSALNYSVFRLDGADYVTLKNFTIKATDADFGWGVHLINGADFNTISNNTINIDATSTTEDYSAGIVFSNSNTSVTSTGNNGNNNLVSDNTITGGFRGIHLNGTSTATGSNQLKNNTIKDFYSTGIKVNTTNNTVVEGNNIFRPARMNATTTLTGIEVGGATQGLEISKNRIHNTHGGASSRTGTVYGIYFTAADAAPNSENIVKNNLIYDINTTGDIYGIYNNNSDGAYYFHNTIDLTNPANTGTVRGFYQTATASNIKFINNIVTIGGTSGVKYALYFGAVGSSIVSDYNVLYPPNFNIGYYSSTPAVTATTLATWKTVKANAYDQNSVSAEPLYLNAATGNLKPTNAPVDNLGQAQSGLSAVTDDNTGAPRSTTTPDAGAYEFTPTANDAGIESIISLSFQVQPNVSLPVEVIVKNYGTNILTSATINWTVNGVAQASFAWTGSLASNQASAPITIGNYMFPAGIYTVEVCTSNPNGSPDANTFSDCKTKSINACVGSSGTYTINKNAPASASNFQSFADALQSITSCGLSGPVTIDVVAGSGPYNEQVTIPFINGSSATNTLTFNGNGNTVSFASTTVNRPVFRFDDADYVTLNNFIIKAIDFSYGWGVHLTNGADFNTISNNTLEINAITNNDNNSAGIVFSNSTTSVSAGGNTGNNNVISGNTITGGYNGINLNGMLVGGAVSNNQLKNNTIRDFNENGIKVNAAKNTVIEGNDISRPALTTVALTSSGIVLSGNSQGTVISKNRIHNTHGSDNFKTSTVYGIYMNASDAPAGAENIVTNNLIYDFNTTGTVYGIWNAGSDGAYYYHNTIELTNPATMSTAEVRGFSQTGAATNIKFINNIVSIAGASGTKHALYFDEKTSNIISDNNVLNVNVTSGGIGYFDTKSNGTLADWQAANTATKYDLNSVIAAPLYVNAASGNFKPTNVQIDNIGQALPGVTEDITGATRSAVAPDAGAYEFSIAANEVGILTVSGPSLSNCGLSGAETITVTFKNYGSATQTSVPVSFSVSGVPMAATPETYKGSIAPGDTSTYTFTAKADLEKAGTYAITATTLLPGDTAISNDAATLCVTNSLLAGLPNVNFETPATGISTLRTVVNPRSNITDGTGASFGTSSTKGMIMDGVDGSWTVPAGLTNPWTNNPDNFSGVYMCISPAGGTASDSLWLTFDLKQLYQVANTRTNFRVTINGTAVGGNQTGNPVNTYRPPFNGIGGTANWTKVKIDLTDYQNDPTIQIGLESSVKEAYANGAGTANLIDNINVVRLITQPTGVKENLVETALHVFPNPGNGIFTIDLPTGNSYTLEVTDLTGKMIMNQKANGNAQLNLEGTAKGIYLLKVSGENGTAVRKLIVE